MNEVPQVSLMADLQALGGQAEEIFSSEGSRVFFPFSHVGRHLVLLSSFFCPFCLLSLLAQLEYGHYNHLLAKTALNRGHHL